MGAGKSTVGKLLARKLGRRFIDADCLIEERCGVKIPVIFEMEGEAGFRRREAQAIKEAVNETGIVLATGGGAVILPENRALLKSHGTVIYLHASPTELWHRTKGGEGRPLLQTGDARQNPRKLCIAFATPCIAKSPTTSSRRVSPASISWSTHY